MLEEELDEQVDEQLDEGDGKTYMLVIYNDDINTFHHVIKTLMKIFQLGLDEAQVKTNEIHHNGQSIIVESKNKAFLETKKELVQFHGLKCDVIEKTEKEE